MSDFNFTTDYSDIKSDSKVLPEGTYECVIGSVSEQASPHGSEKIHFDLIVRNDLDQAMPETNGKHHNQHIWLDEWKSKDTHHYNQGNIMTYMQAVGIPEGVQITSPENFFDLMYHKPVRVTIRVDKNEYQGKVYEKNAAWPNQWDKTQFPQVAHQWKKSNSNNDPFNKNKTTNVDVPAEELPF